VRVLLDTHVFLWWINEHERLSKTAHEILQSPNSEIFVSVVVAWEISIKASLGRFSLPSDLKSFLRQQLSTNRFQVLSVNLDHTLSVYDLPEFPHHKDPFDRLLISQASVEKMPIVSRDQAFDAYDVERIW
jgi:PIN domain nuclease of toxin-antitoxin system